MEELFGASVEESLDNLYNKHSKPVSTFRFYTKEQQNKMFDVEEEVNIEEIMEEMGEFEDEANQIQKNRRSLT